MKKILLVTIGALSLFSSFMVAAQTFTTPYDTVNVTVENSGIYHNDITNISSTNFDISWSVTTDFPADWKAGLGVCDAQLCYANVAVPHSTSGAPYTADSTRVFDMQLSGFAAVTPGTHYVTVTIRDITNTSGTIKSITFMVNKYPTSVTKPIKANDDITLYPNPARNELNVLFNPDAGIKLISVYNLIGKAVTVYKLTSNASAKLDVENLPSGIYFIRLIDGQGQVVATRKFTHQ